jgi:hypothetical protein
MSKTTIPTGGITADAINATLIADDAISDEHIDITAITGQTALAASPADTDEFLINDGGTLKRIDASYVGGDGTGLKHISTTTGTSAVTNFKVTDCFTSTYDVYRMFGVVTFNANGQRLELQYTNNAGNTVHSDANYRYVLNALEDRGSSGTQSGADGHSAGGSDRNSISLMYNGDTDSLNSPVCFDLTFYDPLQSFVSFQHMSGTLTFFNESSGIVTGTIGGHLANNFNATGVNFLSGSSKISRFFVNTYGVINSGS